MNNNCEYASDWGCLCSACHSMRNALEGAERIIQEEIDRTFQEAEKAMKELESHDGI